MHFTLGSVGSATIALLVLIAIVRASAVSSPSDSDEELATMRSCKELCGSCGCLGFYCGEECLCECDANGDDEHDAKCIERMQDRCEAERMPFEVLIQGSTGNRLVRSLLFADSTADDASPGVCIVKDPAMRRKRSTFSIYKPAAAAVAVADEVASKTGLIEQHRERRLTSDNAETLRDVQSFLSEIGAELESELMQREERNAQPRNSHDKRDLLRRELQENERFAVRKRDADSVTPAAEDAAAAVAETTTVGTETPLDVTAVDGDVPADDAVVGVAQNPPAVVTTLSLTTPVAPVVVPVAPVVPVVLPLVLPQQQLQPRLAAALEQLRTKLVTGDSAQLAAMRARKEEVKARMLADLQASQQRMAVQTAAAKQQFQVAKERSAQKATNFQAQFRNQLGNPVVQPNDDDDNATTDADAVVVNNAAAEDIGAKMLADMEANKQRMSEKAAAVKQQFEEAKERSAQKAAEFQAKVRNQLNVAPVVQPNDSDDSAASDGDAVVGAGLPAGLVALQPALHKLRNLLTPGGTVAGTVSNVGRPRLLPVIVPGLGGLSAKKQNLRQKMLTKPGGLAAWARTLGSANPNGDAEEDAANVAAEGVTAVADATESSSVAVDDTPAVTPSAGIVVQPEALVDE